MPRILFALTLIIAAALRLQAQQSNVVLAHDGNLYWMSGQLGGFVSANLGTGLLTRVSNASGLICSETPDGQLLALQEADTQTSIVKISLSGNVTTFATLPRNATTYACPALASDGNYYGGTSRGGTYSYGLLYQLTQTGKLTVFYNFTGTADGEGPEYEAAIQGADGDLYFFSSNLIHYSRTAGLTASSQPIPFSSSSYVQGSDGNFYVAVGSFAIAGTSANTLYKVTTSGVSQEVYQPPSGGRSYTVDNFYGPYALANGTLEVIESDNYGTLSDCGSVSESLNGYPVSLSGTPGVSNYQNSAGYGGEVITITQNASLGGDGNLIGYNDIYSSYGSFSEGCTSSTDEYLLDAALAVSPAPINFGLSRTHVLPGGSATLTWQVNNAYSDTMQQCYGYGGLSGKLPLSGSATVSAPANGTYTSAIICGGTETAYATLSSATQLGLASSVTTIAPGIPVTLTAQISNIGNPAPSGVVTFKYSNLILGTTPISPAGIATFTAPTSNVPPGTYDVVASYSGDQSYAAATSNAATVTVIPKVSTTTALVPASQQVASGTPVYLSATVAGSSAYPPNGSVVFRSGSKVVGTGGLNSTSYSNVSTAVLNASTTGVPAGTYSVTATYGGDGYNLPSTSGPVTVTIASDTVSVTASPNPVPQGSSFTLTATATGSKTTPTGTVFFYAGTQNLGSTTLNGNGVASITLPSGTLAAGTYQVTAQYAGDSNNPAQTSPAITLTVD